MEGAPPAMFRLKGCLKCGGDLYLDRIDWQCLQCGRYYYKLRPWQTALLRRSQHTRPGGRTLDGRNMSPAASQWRIQIKPGCEGRNDLGEGRDRSGRRAR